MLEKIVRDVKGPVEAMSVKKGRARVAILDFVMTNDLMLMKTWFINRDSHLITFKDRFHPYSKSG